MLSASRLIGAAPDAGARPDPFAPALAFALSLPGVVASRDRCGAVTGFRLRAGEALGPADAFFEDGSFARRDSRGALEVILPEALWRRAVMNRLARFTWATHSACTSRATRLDPPASGDEERAVIELVEGAWAHARGL